MITEPAPRDGTETDGSNKAADATCGDNTATKESNSASYTAGETITVSWGIDIAHNNPDCEITLSLGSAENSGEEDEDGDFTISLDVFECGETTGPDSREVVTVVQLNLQDIQVNYFLAIHSF